MGRKRRRVAGRGPRCVARHAVLAAAACGLLVPAAVQAACDRLSKQNCLRAAAAGAMCRWDDPTGKCIDKSGAPMQTKLGNCDVRKVWMVGGRKRDSPCSKSSAPAMAVAITKGKALYSCGGDAAALCDSRGASPFSCNSVTGTSDLGCSGLVWDLAITSTGSAVYAACGNQGEIARCMFDMSTRSATSCQRVQGISCSTTAIKGVLLSKDDYNLVFTCTGATEQLYRCNLDAPGGRTAANCQALLNQPSSCPSAAQMSVDSTDKIIVSCGNARYQYCSFSFNSGVSACSSTAIEPAPCDNLMGITQVPVGSIMFVPNVAVVGCAAKGYMTCGAFAGFPTRSPVPPAAPPPSAHPSRAPSLPPSMRPSRTPSPPPTRVPSAPPTKVPSMPPVKTPSTPPSRGPSVPPSRAPSALPSMRPSGTPSLLPSKAPSVPPTKPPSMPPMKTPSNPPSRVPSVHPSSAPSAPPADPTAAPSPQPPAPTLSPSASPTKAPGRSPSSPPTRSPTDPPARSPSAPPTWSPTGRPSRTPSASPSRAPTAAPSAPPAAVPSAAPSKAPSVPPTRVPTGRPTEVPTSSPVQGPSFQPSARPSKAPVRPGAPTDSPVLPPTRGPSAAPSVSPARSPTAAPVHAPTSGPTSLPTTVPSSAPTPAPARAPSVSPTPGPTARPAPHPTASPIPGGTPTGSPVHPTPPPTASPSVRPSAGPTQAPLQSPTVAPAAAPTARPSAGPSSAPIPAGTPTSSPVVPPTRRPSGSPTRAPSAAPAAGPTAEPSPAAGVPTESPSSPPSAAPSQPPAPAPSGHPVPLPSLAPVGAPTRSPAPPPTAVPTTGPSSAPTRAPSGPPASEPTRRPSVAPSLPPSAAPTRGPTGPPAAPTRRPSVPLSPAPRAGPSARPTAGPVAAPSGEPTEPPVLAPSASPAPPPTAQPLSPTTQPLSPTAQPLSPTAQPLSPTAQPLSPTASPATPTRSPSSPPQPPRAAPSARPSLRPVMPSAPPRPPTASPRPPAGAPSAAPQRPTRAPSATPFAAAPLTFAPVPPTASPWRRGTPTGGPRPPTGAPSDPTLTFAPRAMLTFAPAAPTAPPSLTPTGRPVRASSPVAAPSVALPATSPGSTETLTLTLPKPDVVLFHVAKSVVASAGIAAGLAGMLGMSPAAAAQGPKMARFFDYSTCPPDDHGDLGWMANPTGAGKRSRGGGASGGDSDDPEVKRTERKAAMLANLGVVAGFAAFNALCGAAVVAVKRSRGKRCSIRSGMATARFPSFTMFPALFMLQNVLEPALNLMYYDPVWGDKFLSLLVIAFVGGLPLFVWRVTADPYFLASYDFDRDKLDAKPYVVFLWGDHSWKSSPHDKTFERRYSLVFKDFKGEYHRWLMLDILVVAVISALSAFIAQNAWHCTIQIALATLTEIVYLGAVFKYRPYIAELDHWYTVALTACQVGAISAALVAMHDSHEGLLTASAALLMLSTMIMVLKGFFDLYTFVRDRWTERRIKKTSKKGAKALKKVLGKGDETAGDLMKMRERPSSSDGEDNGNEEEEADHAIPLAGIGSSSANLLLIELGDEPASDGGSGTADEKDESYFEFDELAATAHRSTPGMTGGASLADSLSLSALRRMAGGRSAEGAADRASSPRQARAASPRQRRKRGQTGSPTGSKMRSPKPLDRAVTGSWRAPAIPSIFAATSNGCGSPQGRGAPRRGSSGGEDRPAPVSPLVPDMSESVASAPPCIPQASPTAAGRGRRATVRRGRRSDRDSARSLVLTPVSTAAPPPLSVSAFDGAQPPEDPTVSPTAASPGPLCSPSSPAPARSHGRGSKLRRSGTLDPNSRPRTTAAEPPAGSGSADALAAPGSPTLGGRGRLRRVTRAKR
eukprot:TRINITY_DN13306_c0_g1_i3.p1 TRINITY_DN13306_c0_g1~~TRINITY_DN13306_c0_g1_i3.p1  ORF type:complete len:1857 (+),score=250.54 TRINITY_DN13306_c0_g1_i3:117-5687(+)